ncbi:hypothetical protein [Vibrio owensii]|uniref:hypothetical protein n=1 Tax=Vibrio owensii TaxID=696485 RepID=UPI0018F1AD13|nr:hypothetical protein [Vibrio owensii]
MINLKQSRVISFGSDLSVRTSRLLEEEYGWKRLSSVTNQKVTQFARIFDENAPALDDLTIVDLLGFVKLDSEDYEAACNAITSQNYRVAGSFSSPSVQDLEAFSVAVDSNMLTSNDLVILDTYNDVSRLVYRDIRGKEVMVEADLMQPEFHADWKAQPKQPVHSIVKAFEMLVKYIRSHSNEVKIIILNHPFSGGAQIDDERSNELANALQSSALLAEKGVCVMCLPEPGCLGGGADSCFLESYYHNVVQLMTKQNARAELAMIGSSKFVCEHQREFELLDFTVPIKAFQRLDAIVERDIWQSKLDSSLAVPAGFSGALDLGSLGEGAKVIVDLEFLLSERLTFGCVDEVGVGLHAQCLQGEHVEEQPLSVAKSIAMLEIFIEWVAVNRPDIEVIVWDSTATQLADCSVEVVQRHKEFVLAVSDKRMSLMTGSWLSMPTHKHSKYFK